MLCKWILISVNGILNLEVLRLKTAVVLCALAHVLWALSTLQTVMSRLKHNVASSRQG